MKPSLRMKPSARMKPLPLDSQLLSVAVGRKAPVRADHELLPASPLAATTPGVTSAWFGAGASATERTKVSAGTPAAAGQ